LIFGIVHWTLFAVLIYLFLAFWNVNWVWVLIGSLLYGVFFVLGVIRIIRHFYHFPIPSFMTKIIDNPLRRRFLQNPEVIADRMHLQPGMIVVEIGPGKGTYTKAVAKRILPDGKVYAVDISENVVEKLKGIVKEEGITNIIPQIEDAYNFSFANESVDRVYAICCLPEIPEPVKALQDCCRILKPDGVISLSEMFLDPDYPRRKTEKRWASEAGLELKEEFGRWTVYQLNFGKKG
jgi:SAM-dependent methyltransferase